MKGLPFLIAILVATPVAAQDLASAPIGTKVEMSAIVYGRVVPLPPGSFELVSRLLERSQNKTVNGTAVAGGPQVHMAAVWLMSTASGSLDATVYIRTNQETLKGWNINKACSQAHYFTYLNGDSGREFDCWFVGAHTFDIHHTPSPQLMEFLKRTGEVDRPNVMPDIYQLVSRKGSAIEAEYSFSPRRWGLKDDNRPWAQNSWRSENAKKDPARARVMQLLTDQGQALCDALKAGIDGHDGGLAWKLD
jgi:hypothetical protein